MAFASGLFLFLFLPIFLAVYYLLPPVARRPWVLVASWFFYAWWRLDFLALLIGATIITWLVGRWVYRARVLKLTSGARIGVALGVTVNLALLAYFKYANFGIQSLNALLGAFGGRALATVSIVLPVGVSFYAFKAVSYLVDLYHGAASPAESILDLAVYIAFFPQVTAGPITRFGDFGPQLAAPRPSLERFSSGALRFALGFCKKVLIADTVAPLANAAFSLARPTAAEAWLGAAAYMVQIYFDFSGYSDMAIGLGSLMGMETPENFRTPYLSRSITEFWRRWHISLSSWLRDYLYIPLGGNRKGKPRTYLNLMLVMLIGGLWHGSAWTFVLWGAWHGVLLAFERWTGLGGDRPDGRRSPNAAQPSGLSGRRRSAGRLLPKPLAIAGTSLAVLAGWVVFRAASGAGALRMFGGMLGLHGLGMSPAMRWQTSGLAVTVLGCALVSAYAGPWLITRWQEGRHGSGALDLTARWLANRAWVVVLPLFLLGVLKILADSYAPFLYAKF